MSHFYYPSKTPTATKDYPCNACEVISCTWNESDINQLTESESEAYELAKSHKFRILKGEKYISQAGVYDGQFYNFKGIPAMVDICHKYELFSED